MTEIKTTMIFTLSLGYMLIGTLLQLPAHDFEVFSIIDKISTIGILVYISYTLNKKLELMQENFQKEETLIRKEFLDRTNELVNKLIELYSKIIDRK